MEQQVSRPFYKKWWVIALAIFFGVGIIGTALDKNENAGTQTANQPVQTQQVVAENKNTPPVVEKTTPAPTKIETKTAPVVTPTPAPQPDRASVLAILKANASAKWKDDFQMVKYEYDNQVTAYDWVMAQTEYPNIMAGAKKKWGNDYQMVKYEYENQVKAYQSL